MTKKRLSRRDHLAALVADGADEATALMRLAAYHTKSEKKMIPVRTTNVAAGDQVFPPAAVLSELVSLMIYSIRYLMSECRNDSDDLIVAVYGMYAVSAIHPFSDANGHVAVDFGQYLLMKRWKVSEPPLYYESNTHKTLALAFAPLDRRCTGDSAQEFQAAYEFLLDRFSQTTLTDLWKLSNLVAVAHFFAEASGHAFESRLPAAPTA
jgi:Fic family protein